jgi:hypothetical protein
MPESLLSQLEKQRDIALENILNAENDEDFARFQGEHRLIMIKIYRARQSDAETRYKLTKTVGHEYSLPSNFNNPSIFK